MKSLIVFCLTATSAFCQLLSIGVKAGVPLGDAYPFPPANISQAHRYLVGATTEVHLPLGFSVELDAIYKRTGLIGGSVNNVATFKDNVRANQWEFPLLAKYEFRGRGIRPFVDAGPVLRHISGIKDVYQFTFAGSPPISFITSGNSSSLLAHRNTAGFVVGGGVTLKLLQFRISPEIRYTRWANNSFLGATDNQEDLIVGFTF